MARAKLFLLCTTLGLFFMCQSQNDKLDTRILEVFSDFSFVGSGPTKLNDDGSVDVTHIPLHDESEQSKPKRLEMGVQYIFHHRVPVDNEVMGLQDLPRKLSEKGFKIVGAPKSSSDLMHLFYGGPLFRIKFSDGNYVGLVFNSLHMNLKDGWTEHDYILVYTR
jgi:hypothetical protein